MASALFRTRRRPGGDLRICNREIASLLTARVQGGSPPDVAIPAEVGLFKQFVQQGKLAPLSKCPGLEQAVKSQYPQSFLDLGTVNGTLYGFFMKADTKATIFYNPAFFSQKGFKPLTADSTLDDLIKLAEQIKASGTPPFSFGVEAGSGSGFPGTDIVHQILINTAPPKTYDGIVDGSIPFNDPA